MSKGIVMEKHRKFTIVVASDGSFQKVKPIKDAEIGAEVSYETLTEKQGGLLFFPTRKKNSVPIRYIAIACMVLLFVMPFYFFSGDNKTYAYVNLDINPSVEIEINEELNVVSITPLNADAKKLLEKLPDYKDKQVVQFIEIIMNKSVELGLTKNGKNVMVGVSYIDTEDISVIDSVDKYFAANKTSWKIATFQVPMELRKRALKENISMNKVLANTMDNSNTEPEKYLNQPRTNDDEKELIRSFYINSSNDHQNEVKDEKNTVNQDNINPSAAASKPLKEKEIKQSSELKKQNGKIHSKGKNQIKKPEEVKKEKKKDKMKHNPANKIDKQKNKVHKDKDKENEKNEDKNKDKHKKNKEND
ncbi:anti-sigma factor domain-containing protein [Virgibacillus flavescens]|uniref:anti-sigma factor domain-containing protein n=1 Tax=Virgibacillus flavescens TaxID=1611422 RepID=UPI003D32EC1C